MDARYKVILSSRHLYKEIELSEEQDIVKVGTSSDCNVRLRRDLFFSPIDLVFQKNERGWTVLCSDDIYISDNNVMKLFTKDLEHGDEVIVKYNNSNEDVFSLSFMVDFEYENKEYNLEINVESNDTVRIGGNPEAEIYINDKYIGKDFLILSKHKNQLVLNDNGCRYGVFLNGIRIHNQAVVEERDFFSLAGFSFYYKNGRLFTTEHQNMIIHRLDSKKIADSLTNLKYPKFNRNTRIQYEINENEIEIQQPVQKPAKSNRNIILTLIPALVMLAMTVVLRGIMGGGGTFVIYSAVSMSVGMIMSVVSYIEEKKKYRKEYEERISQYNDYIDKKKKSIEDLRNKELETRRLIYESIDKSIQEVENFGKRLFERSLDNKDFLKVYLGTGTVESINPVKYTKNEFADLEDPLANVAEEVAESYKYIDNAPVISDFNVSSGIGITGNKRTLGEILKNITLDISIRHFYKEVKMVYILDNEYYKKMEWIRWLRNVNNEKLDVKNIVCDEESKNIILENIYNTLSLREFVLQKNNDVVFEEQYVVFVTDIESISTHPISKYIKNSNKYGFTFVFLVEYEENLPQGCTEIIRVRNEKEGCVLKSENGDVITDFQYQEVSDELAEEVALKLGSIYVDEVSLEGELTKNLTMYEMLGILSAEDIDLKSRWDSSKVYKSLAAPMGVKKNNDIVYLDISDKAGAHGPHGLVAGTTGSGKSEILQTYILSMATLYHPYEVGFVIIDFKGGGMANQFKDLPHLIGTITNIDGKEINRSLLSIKAELIKRQELFSECGVNHINDYIKLYKNGEVSVPMPHLILIADEFAELKQEFPEFMKELISAARIGRTLGVHLILATQKPAGVVDAQIWSNSKFKMCLKVQTKEDSNEVIKTPLAAEIVEPGRAYFQVGNNETFDLFQSAYSGADVPVGNENKDNIYEIYEKNMWGKKNLIYTNKKKEKSNSSVTQLEAIVNYVKAFCDKYEINRLPGICLPSLKNIIRTSEISASLDGNVINVPIGIYDDPEQQKQDCVKLNISRDNIFIVGSAQTGKTVLLQTIVYELINNYTPNQVQLYIVDCGSMVLKLFEESVSVGGVVLSNEEEKCKNLFKLLNTFVKERKKILASRGVGNYLAYLEAGYRDMPLAVVVIDNMAAFKEYFPNQSDELNSLAREAQGVGISFIITAATTNALSYRTQANFGTKVALNCNDKSEYSALFGNSKIVPDECPGRGLFMKDKRVLEFQAAIFGESEKEAERSQELKDFVIEKNKSAESEAIEIPMIPEKLYLNESIEKYPGLFRKAGIIPCGMDYSSVEYMNIDIYSMGSLSLMGDAESRNRFVMNFTKTIAATAIFHNTEAIVIDDKNETLNFTNEFGYVKAYTNSSNDGIELIERFCEEVIERANDDETYENCLMLVVNNNEVFKKICNDKLCSKIVSDALKCIKDAKAFMLFTNVPNQAAGFNSPEVLKTLKDEKTAMLFMQLTDNKMYDIYGRIKADPGYSVSVGYYLDDNGYSKVKIFE